jgi:integrase
MTIGFFLAKPKLERSSVDVIVRYDKVRYKRGIGVSVLTKYWNADKSLCHVPKSYPEGAKANFEIARWRRAIDAACARIEHEVENASEFWELVDAEMGGAKTKSTLSFLEYFERVFIRRFLSTKSETRIRRFNVVLRKLRDFEEHTGRRYGFGDIDISFYRALQSYMYGRRHSPNYFGTVVKVVKQVMKEAALIDKLHTNTEYLHSDFKVVTQEVDAVYLTLDELDRLHKKPVDEGFIRQFYPLASAHMAANIIQSYTIVKNRFLIGAFTGLRVSDFNRLSADNIRDGKIYMVTKKTAEPVVIPIHPVIREILDGGFDMSASLSEDKTRKYIKHLCRYAGIDTPVDVRTTFGGTIAVVCKPKYELVGTHTARRSFLTNAYLKGEKPVFLMRISGHKLESTFLSYLKMGREETADILARGDFFQGR